MEKTLEEKCDYNTVLSTRKEIIIALIEQMDMDYDNNALLERRYKHIIGLLNCPDITKI